MERLEEINKDAAGSYWFLVENGENLLTDHIFGPNHFVTVSNSCEVACIPCEEIVILVNVDKLSVSVGDRPIVLAHTRNWIHSLDRQIICIEIRLTLKARSIVVRIDCVFGLFYCPVAWDLYHVLVGKIVGNLRSFIDIPAAWDCCELFVVLNVDLRVKWVVHLVGDPLAIRLCNHPVEREKHLEREQILPGSTVRRKVARISSWCSIVNIKSSNLVSVEFSFGVNDSVVAILAVWVRSDNAILVHRLTSEFSWPPVEKVSYQHLLIITNEHYK